MNKKIFKIKNMHCPSCALMIESDLEDAGFKASCNYPKATLEVEFDQQLINENKIREVVKASGYELI